MVTALTLLALDAAGFGPIRSARRSVLVVRQPVGALVGAVAAPAVGAWHGAVHHDDLVAENDVLRRRLAEAEGRLAAAPDLEAELRALEEAVGLDHLGDVDHVTGRVVADRRSDVERTIEIDVGSTDGVERGMPAVTGAGLVGTVVEVLAGRTVVRPIVDPGTSVGVRSAGGLGLVVARPDGGLVLEMSPELADAVARGEIADGERLFTSGAARSLLPAGIPVGVLTIGDDGPTVRPLADLERPGYLSVLLVEAAA